MILSLELNSTLFMVSGKFRIIHFPFDVEVDTAISVASEMVQELELTNQDAATIAQMIDSEVRYLIPDWNPNETPTIDSNDQKFSISSGHRDVTSPQWCNFTTTGSLSLERLPSGRNYWSDPPMIGGNSPLRHGSSKLSYQVDSNAIETSTTYNSTSAEGQEDNCSRDGYDSIGKKSSGAVDSHSNERDITYEDSQAINREESEDVNLIAAKLKQLLEKNQEEEDELKRRHELEVSDFLKVLPLEIKHEVVNVCNLEANDSRNMS